MKELLAAYASYNRWAYIQLTNTILEMDEHLHLQIVKSSFPNLYPTVLHLWDAESIWWQRVEGHQQWIIPGKQFNPTMKDAVNGLLQHAGEWERFVQTATDEQLQREFDFKNIKGEPCRSFV
jgi:uncharacterized damage-inducible protein DinB